MEKMKGRSSKRAEAAFHLQQTRMVQIESTGPGNTGVHGMECVPIAVQVNRMETLELFPAERLNWV